MLSRALVQNGRYDNGRFIVIYPMQNYLCDRAVKSYKKYLISNEPSESGCKTLTLEDCIAAYREISDLDMVDVLYGRYLDFERVEDVIFS